MKYEYTLLPFCIFLLLSTIITGCQPANSTNPVYEQIERLIANEHAADNFHGTITVASGDSVLYNSAVGIADRVRNIPVRSDTRFDIASVNKSFIAGLVMIAVQEGKIKTSDSMGVLLNAYDYPGQFHPEITIHQLMTHTSGLPDYNAVPDSLKSDGYRAFKRLHFTNEEYVSFISQLPAVSAPGVRFYYSNFAYHLLCIILEDIYEQPFSEILQQKICDPLRMSNTVNYTDNEKVIANLADAYTYDKAKDTWVANNFIDLTLGRRIFSTSEDLVKWAMAMNDDRMFSAASLSLIRQNHLTDISEKFSYGYGWVVIEPGSEVSIGNLGLDEPYMIHGGSTEGYKSMLINIDRGEYIIAFLSNVGNNTDEMNLAKKITQILTDKKYRNE